MDKLQYLNLGCGGTFEKNWTNIDFVSDSEYVIQHNLLKGIPFPDESFKLTYSSHMLEHIPRKNSTFFIKECYRVLKPGGIIRVVVPDLEQIAINYLKYLNEASTNIPNADKKYEWTLIELFDQIVREETGGEMIEFIRNTSNIDDFLIERNGNEVIKIIATIRNKKNAIYQPGLKSRILTIFKLDVKAIIQKIVLGNDYEGYQKYKFRKQGEIHQWMYDRYSIKRILENAGFKNVSIFSAFDSNIDNWSQYCLDVMNGKVRKPDSLFIEAVK